MLNRRRFLFAAGAMTVGAGGVSSVMTSQSGLTGDNGDISTRIAPGIKLSNISSAENNNIEFNSDDNNRFNFATKLHQGESTSIQLTLVNQAVNNKSIKATINSPSNVRVTLSTTTSFISVVQIRPDTYRFQLPGKSSFLSSKTKLSINIQLLNDISIKFAKLSIRMEPLNSSPGAILPTIYESDFDYSESPFDRGWIKLQGNAKTRDSALTSNSFPLIYRDLGQQIDTFRIVTEATNEATFGGLRIGFSGSQPRDKDKDFVDPLSDFVAFNISQRSGNNNFPNFPNSPAIRFVAEGATQVFVGDGNGPSAKITLRRDGPTSPIEIFVDNTKQGELDAAVSSIRYIFVNLDPIRGSQRVDSVLVQGRF